ncbi:Nop14-like protein [Tilletiaria anomala UBC 951]|uniref:Nop14-like protein n=1 Tax=Tilletiaria anomala (strain ATCC 24038 / CBS 436.72 / UBC 951) TaxID=1037660 RepID=A0A066VR40_TILAU|nr:Nop14-like protein [Tilletiaria anomala UBC 951]KDN43906.1 Nop14-like protein [Tilletiaria anomala UBC 951]
MEKKGSGGSQLSQLKARVHSEGLHAFASAGGKKGKGKGKQRAANGAGDGEGQRRGAKLAALSSSFASDFDTKLTKPKHEVLGKRSGPSTVKGAIGRPAQAKSGGIAAREATLLPELQNRHKSGTFVDRRFGENDPSLSLEQRMLERFTHERQRERKSQDSGRPGGRGKESVFNLNDGEEEGLTHYGQSLSTFDDDDDMLGLPSDEEGPPLQLPEDAETEDAEGKEDRPRTKAEIMAEVMLKSKMAKHERQQVKEADDDVRRELDDELDDLRGLLMEVPSALANGVHASEPMVKSRKRLLEEEMKAREEERAKVGVPREVPVEGQDSRAASIAALTTAADTHKKPVSALAPAPASGPGYDSVLRELAFERRAKPSDRLKTDAELAAEEATRLQSSERARQRRMRGDDEDDDDAGDAEGGGKRKRGNGKERAKARRVPGGDDLEDDFDLGGVTAGEAYGLGQGLNALRDDDSDEGDQYMDSVSDVEVDSNELQAAASQDGDEDEDNEGNDEEDEHNYNDLADLDGLAEPGEQLDSDEEKVAGAHAEALVDSRMRGKKSANAKKASNDSSSKTSGSTLPFTFPCPATHDEFLDILEDNKIATKDVPTVIKRIRTLYHASLAEDNKNKLQVFLRVLVDHAIYSADQAQRASAAAAAGALKKSGSSAAAREAAVAETRVNVALLNSLLTPIFDISKTYTSSAAHIFVAKLRLMQRNLTRGLASQSVASTSPSSSTSTKSVARTWPGFAELSFFRLAGLVWPTSDRQHAVATPMMILVAQYLAHCRIRAASAIADMACGLYLCTLVASFERDSKRLVPEALNFLHYVCALLAPLNRRARASVQAKAAEAGIPMLDFDAEHMRKLRLPLRGKMSGQPVKGDSSGVDLSSNNNCTGPADLLGLLIFNDDISSDAGEAARVQLFSTCLSLLQTFSEMWNGSESYVELFEPAEQLLALTQPFLSSATKEPQQAGFERVSEQASSLQASLGKRIQFARGSRRTLRLQAHRALAIASYVPKFEQNGFDPRRRQFDPDVERAQHAKLTALVKKERKGAVRELRRDAQFVAQVRERERQEEEKGYKRKMDKIMSELQTERSEEKKLEKEKARMKKRR